MLGKRWSARRQPLPGTGRGPAVGQPTAESLLAPALGSSPKHRLTQTQAPPNTDLLKHKQET